MAIVGAELEAFLDGYSQVNDLERWSLFGETTSTVIADVKEAVTSAQIYCLGGHISVDGATTVEFHTSSASADTSTLVGCLEFVAAGTLPVPICASKAGDTFAVRSDTDVTLFGFLHLRAVTDGSHVHLMP